MSGIFFVFVAGNYCRLVPQRIAVRILRARTDRETRVTGARETVARCVSEGMLEVMQPKRHGQGVEVRCTLAEEIVSHLIMQLLA